MFSQWGNTPLVLQRFYSFSGMSDQDEEHLLKGVIPNWNNSRRAMGGSREPEGSSPWHPGDTWQVERSGRGLLNLIRLPQTQMGINYP